MWEQYAYPVTLKTLLADKTIAHANKLQPPMPASKNVYINKTGATHGFRSYIAFIPAKQIGIVILINKAVPFNLRKKLGYAILTDILSH